MMNQDDARFVCCRSSGRKKSVRPIFATAAVAIAAFAAVPQASLADEGGVSFWVPGVFGSLAATPQQPAWSFATIFYDTSVAAGAAGAFAREVQRGDLNATFAGN